MTSQDINSHLQSIDPSKFRTPRENDPRLAESSQSLNIEDLNIDNQWILLGQPDDEGVSLNRGRIGAATAPNTIRKYLYALVDHNSTLYDCGNTDPEKKLSLKDRQDLAYQCSKLIFENNKLLSLGGGHDYAYPNVKAFIEKYPTNSLVLNIDAHLDLRPCDPEPHSGTGFRRIFEEGLSYKLIEYGIQKSFASAEQIKFAKDNNVEIIYFEECKARENDIINKIKAVENLYLSIDIDAFSSGIAPGASAAWPIGLQFEHINPILDCIKESQNLKGLGIYEVAPSLDQDDKTSKLAAQLIYIGLNL